MERTSVKTTVAKPLESGNGQVGAKGRFRRLLRSRLVREVSWSFVIRSAQVGLVFLATVLLARLLGAEGYGIYAYAYALVTLVARPVQLGLAELMMRETARGMAEGRPDLVRGVWQWMGRVVVLLLGVLVLLVGPVLVIWQGGLASISGRTMAWALVVLLFFGLGSLPGAALRGLGRVVQGLIPEYVVGPGLLLMLVGGVALVAQDVLSPVVAMALHAGALLVALGVGLWLWWRRVPEVVRRVQPSVETRGWLTSGLVFGLMSSFGVVNSQAGTVLLGMFAEPEAVGVFRVALQVAALASFALQAVNLVVAPRFAELYTRGEMAKLERLAVGSARAVFAFNVVLTVGFVGSGRFFFEQVFGKEFAAAYGPLLVLLVGQMVNSAVGSVGYLLSMTGHERETAQGMAVAAVVNVVLGLALIPWWGIYGAAIATTVAVVIWNGILWLFVYKKIGVNSFVIRKYHNA